MPAIMARQAGNPTSHPQDIEQAVRALKQERDTWRAVAEQYKNAFDGQTARLHELQAICVVTQLELENESTIHRQSAQSEASVPREGVEHLDGAQGGHDASSFGTATIVAPSYVEISWQPPAPKPIHSCFDRVEQLISQHDYGIALREVDHLLRGPLAPEARIEGLLLKSNIMRKSEWVYDALAACSEALEVCHRLEELRTFLPKIQYQRGVCYYQLSMVQQARDAFGDVCKGDDLMYAKASELRGSCEEQLELASKRRSGFEAHRAVTEGLLAQYSTESIESKRRRTSSQLRLHVSKAKRLSLPHRWVTTRSRSCALN